MKEIRILQDDREKRAVLFPETIIVDGKLHKIVVTKQRLKTCDYVDADFPKVGGVETKRGELEIYDYYLGAKYDNGIAQLDRMAAEFQFPTLLLEVTPHQLMTYDYDADIKRRSKGQEEAVRNAGTRLVQAVTYATNVRAIPVIWNGLSISEKQKYSMGELIVNVLIAARKAAKDTKKILKKSGQRPPLPGIIKQGDADGNKRFKVEPAEQAGEAGLHRSADEPDGHAGDSGI